jgi:acyl carrier protein
MVFAILASIWWALVAVGNWMVQTFSSSTLLYMTATAVIVAILLAPFWRRHQKRKQREFALARSRWAQSRFAPPLHHVAETVADIVCEQLGVGLAQLEPHTTFFGDLGADELEPDEIVMALEEEFQIEISDEDAERIETISDLVAYIHRRVGSRVWG